MLKRWHRLFVKEGIALNRSVRTADLYVCTLPYLQSAFSACEFPWELLPKIGDLLTLWLREGLAGFTELCPGILVGEGVSIAQTAVLEAPAIIGPNTVVRPGAYLRGNVITGRGCVLGNSSEFKNCLLLDGVQAPHYNYVGDSVLGNGAHMGAGAVCSNLKSDGKPVIVHGDVEYATGLRKVGGFLADGADVGCGCVVNPGTVIGKGTAVYPLTALRGVYPAQAIVKSPTAVVARKRNGP